jgi:hypothetical protein
MMTLMPGIPGGSAYGLIRQIAQGHLLVTERTFQRLSGAELDKLSFEIERHLRELRGEHPPTDDQAALQARNRRIDRLRSARMILQNSQRRLRR